MNTIYLAVWHLTSSRLKPVLQVRVTARLRGMHAIAFSRTGFSREEACMNTINLAVWHLTPSRLKPVPLENCMHSMGPSPMSLDTRDAVSGTGFSREEAGVCAIKCAACHRGH